MALVAHTIVSRYTPQQRETIAHVQAGVCEDDPWQTECSYGRPERLHSRPHPRFVAATLKYDEYGMPNSISQPYPLKMQSTAGDVSAWYRDVSSRSGREVNIKENQPLATSPPDPRPTFSSISLRASPHLAQPSPQKVNWFTSRLPAYVSTTLMGRISKPSAFADLLSRNPPPLPSGPAFRPPVFLTLGPGNKGFAMLQQKGWREGEALGSARTERTPRECLVRQTTSPRVPKANEFRQTVAPGPESSISNAQQEVIDLTLSESDEEYETVGFISNSQWYEGPHDMGRCMTPLACRPPKTQSHGTSLLTPISTTLKADRFGIGIKAVRGPSVAQNKAITHSSSTIAAHIRSGIQVRKEKAKHGRGSRGFATKKRKEELERVRMLAYLKS